VVTSTDSLHPVDGYLPVPRTAPRPDPDLLYTYAVTDPAQEQWWRTRLGRVTLT
jgi:o-succinylbenzoate synthase